MNDVISQLPAAFRKLVPELESVSIPDETEATCQQCPVAARGEPTTERPFHPQLRCCTFRPTMPNFLAGRALLRGGVSAERMLRRVATGEGIDAWGIQPPPAWRGAYAAGAQEGFGRETSWRCPYWVGGELSCGIWQDRSATCRTWFCRHTDGPRSRSLWFVLKEVLRQCEGKLARRLVEVGAPPGEDASLRDRVRWFSWCALRVELFTEADLLELRDPALDELVRLLRERAARIGAPLPEVLGPTVAVSEPGAAGLWMAGSSTLHGLWLPRDIFTFLAALDGKTPWRTAAERTGVPAEMVERMYRVGLLDEPDPADAVAGGVGVRVEVDGQVGSWSAPGLDEALASLRPGGGPPSGEPDPDR